MIEDFIFADDEIDEEFKAKLVKFLKENALFQNQ